MKQLIYIIIALCCLGCAKSEDITPHINIPNEYSINDNPNDSIQHFRYIIYQKYGVPVFFNDTIAQQNYGVDINGEQLYNYETIDLAWNFAGHNSTNHFKYLYLTDPAEKMQSLRYVEAFLQKVSQPMRPFSIMIADTLFVTANNKIEKPTYYVGLRAIAFSQIKEKQTEDEIRNQVDEILKNMIFDRVSTATDITSQFGDISAKEGWYDRKWADLDKCPTIIEWQKKSWVISVNALYDEPPFTPFDHKDIISILTESHGGLPPYVQTIEEAQDIRQSMLNEMGAYGFLRGWKETASYTPKSDTEDRKHFVAAIMQLGHRGFTARYKHLPIVMDKYNILYQYIAKTLEVNLDYDGRTDETSSTPNENN